MINTTKTEQKILHFRIVLYVMQLMIINMNISLRFIKELQTLI